MEFKIVNMHLTNNKGACKALADLVLDGDVTVFGIKLLMSDQRLSVGMPSRKRGESYDPMCAVINKELLESITVAIVAKYNEIQTSATNGRTRQ